LEIKCFKDLIAWQKAMELARLVYHATTTMPDNERFGLTSQVTETSRVLQGLISSLQRQ